MKDANHTDRLIVEKTDEIMEKIHQDRYISYHDIAKELNIHHQTVLNHLKKAGYKNKLEVWVPHELSLKNSIDRTNICDSLLKRIEIESFQGRMIKYGLNWIKYDTNGEKIPWWKQGEALQTVEKPGLPPSKVMVCFFG